jgi:hypothetical protein
MALPGAYRYAVKEIDQTCGSIQNKRRPGFILAVTGQMVNSRSCLHAILGYTSVK